MIRFVDLFAGLGGFHVAATAVGGRCVFASEIDEGLRSSYERNFGVRPAGDLRRFPPREVPAHDLLCAGFPCQPFSKAGEQNGFRDRVRGTVIFNVLEILRVRKPRMLVLENVPHFTRHREGRTYDTLVSRIRSLGYSVDARELSPDEFGVPQIRKRMYLVGVRGSLEAFRWPVPDANVPKADLREMLDSYPAEGRALGRGATRCINVWQEFLRLLPRDAKIPSFPVWSMEFGANYPTDRGRLTTKRLTELAKWRGAFGDRLHGSGREEILRGLPAYARAEFPHWKQRFIRQNREFYMEHRGALAKWIPKVRELPASFQKFEWNCQGGERNMWRYLLQFRASGLRVKRPTHAPSLVAINMTQVPIVGWERRYMTIRECARLQSLDGLKSFPLPTPGFRALGNAVNSHVAKLVIRELLKCAEEQGRWVGPNGGVVKGRRVADGRPRGGVLQGEVAA